MFVKFYVKSKYIMRLAESFDYEMQLKPYAHIYDEFKKQKKIQVFKSFRQKTKF